MVLPEELCLRLTALAEKESRTISNMAKVLIQDGVTKLEEKAITDNRQSLKSTEGFRSALEAQEPKRLRGAPRRFKLYKP